ncbi:CsiV family protein [Marinobacter sp. GN3S48]|uniref:CsiV family protein n=1 Tax=Marinobacter sp. GN3S48 TaxID=3382302 RepID=UPI00387B97C2
MPGYALPGKALITFTAALLALAPLLATAQEGREHLYRAEIVIVERIVDPGNVEERMASRMPEPATNVSKQVKVIREDGSVGTTLRLAPDSDLRLQSVAQRLENSGRYRVLMTAGWYQSFPPDYDGEPMQIAVGDWLAGAGHREVEGQITIDRQRYLHVDVHLNHWQPAANAVYPVQASAEGDAQQAAGSVRPAELLTWIRETRRMRSEEVHFLDSPTIGVLVFFRPVEG